ncbi:MAG: hypothetical protein ACWA41_06540 [Putridiphycobacter sp.]
MKLNCPYCQNENEISRWRLMSPKIDLIQCQHCQKTITTNVKHLSVWVAFHSMFMLAIFRWASHEKDKNPIFSYILFGLALLIGVYTFYFYFKKLKFSKNQYSELSPEDIKKSIAKQEAQIEFDKEVERFKKQYKAYSKAQLLEVINEPGWQLAAVEAAQQLLNEE